jgi:hypothetical protein
MRGMKGKLRVTGRDDWDREGGGRPALPGWAPTVSWSGCDHGLTEG